MDILDDMGVSKLSAKVFFFFLSELLLESPAYVTRESFIFTVKVQL